MGFPRERASNDTGGCRKRKFSVLSLVISSEAVQVRPTALHIPSAVVTLYCRVTLNKNSNSNIFVDFHYYVTLCVSYTL